MFFLGNLGSCIILRAQVGPKSNNKCPYKRPKRRHREEKIMWKSKAETGSDMATNQETLKIPGSHQKPGGKRGTNSLSEHPEGSSSVKTWFWLLLAKTIQE